MSELDDLPSWAGRSTEEVQLPTGPPEQEPTGDAAPEATDPPANGQPEIAAPTAAAQAPDAPPASPPPAESPPTESPARAAAVPPASPPPIVTEEAAPATLAQPAVLAQPRRRRLRPLLLGLVGLVVLAAAAGIGYTLASRDSDSTEASGAGTADEADPATEAEDADADTGTTDTDGSATDADGSEAAAEAEDGSETVTVEVDGDDDADADADTSSDDAGDGEEALNDGDRQAIFRGGKVYLSGAVPSEEIGAAIVAKAEAVVGPGNVVNEYVIDPSTTIVPGDSAPLYVEDVILFGFNSIEIAPPFLPILDLGTLLLSQNPQASVTVVTRTDAVGSEEVNLEVARRRAQAVIDYWLSKGVDADQIIADPRGEEGTSDDDDAETAAGQRRAEFIITGLLD